MLHDPVHCDAPFHISIKDAVQQVPALIGQLHSACHKFACLAGQRWEQRVAGVQQAKGGGRRGGEFPASPRRVKQCILEYLCTNDCCSKELWADAISCYATASQLEACTCTQTASHSSNTSNALLATCKEL